MNNKTKGCTEEYCRRQQIHKLWRRRVHLGRPKIFKLLPRESPIEIAYRFDGMAMPSVTSSLADGMAMPSRELALSLWLHITIQHPCHMRHDFTDRWESARVTWQEECKTGWSQVWTSQRWTLGNSRLDNPTSATGHI